MLQSGFANTDTRPWYRQFWPWFLIALPGSVVVAAVTTLIIAASGSDDLVVDEYYKDGLAINRQLEREERARARGYAAELTIARDRVSVDTEVLPAVASLRLRLSHPMEADRDFSIELRRSGPQRYEAGLPVAVGDNWHWLLDAGDGSDWRLTGVTGTDSVSAQRTPR